MFNKKIIIVATLTPIIAIAKDYTSTNPHWYIGLDLGQSYYSNGGNPSAIDFDRHRFAAGIRLGYQFNDFFSLETAYQYMGDPFANYDHGKVEAEFHQGVLASKLGYAIGDNLYPYIKLGGSYWVGEERGLINASADGFSPLTGAGIEYSFNNDLAFQVEYQYTDSIGDSSTGFSDHHFTSIGITYKFGYPKSVKNITPSIFEKDVISSTSQKTGKIIFPDISNKVMFNNNSYVLINTDPLKHILDYAIANPQYHFTIVGYTDSNGSNEYNRNLSNMRANAVLNYFLNNGIKANRMKAIGEGENNPIADNNTDDGRALNRRVEISISKTEL